MIDSAKLAGLLHGPLVWLAATLAVYAAATALWRRHGKAPILNRTMLSIIAIGAVLLLSGVPYPAYLDGVVILNYVLGTAVVAVVTIMTGITTAVVGPYVLDLLGVRAPETRGLALGVSGHGIATARAFSESEAAGSFASIGTALNASLTAALVPLAVWALGLM